MEEVCIKFYKTICKPASYIFICIWYLILRLDFDFIFRMNMKLLCWDIFGTLVFKNLFNTTSPWIFLLEYCNFNLLLRYFYDTSQSKDLLVLWNIFLNSFWKNFFTILHNFPKCMNYIFINYKLYINIFFIKKFSQKLFSQ